MSSFKPVAGAVVLVFGIALHAGAQAASCFDRSPNYENDDYFNLDEPVKLSSSEQRKLDQVFRSLKGDWDGRGEKLSCWGSMRSPREQFEPLEVKAELAPQQKGALRLEEELRYPESRKNRNQAVKLSHASPIMSFELRGNQVIVSEKFRRRSGGNSIFVENVYEISPRGKSLEVVRSYYVGGYLAGREHSSLQRVR